MCAARRTQQVQAGASDEGMRALSIGVFYTEAFALVACLFQLATPG